MPLPSRSHPTHISFPSRSHPAPIPFPSPSNPAPIPLSSRSHPAHIPLKSRSHTAHTPLPSRSHPAKVCFIHYLYVIAGYHSVLDYCLRVISIYDQYGSCTHLVGVDKMGVYRVDCLWWYISIWGVGGWGLHGSFRYYSQIDPNTV